MGTQAMEHVAYIWKRWDPSYVNDQVGTPPEKLVPLKRDVACHYVVWSADDKVKVLKDLHEATKTPYEWASVIVLDRWRFAGLWNMEEPVDLDSVESIF